MRNWGKKYIFSAQRREKLSQWKMVRYAGEVVRFHFLPLVEDVVYQDRFFFLFCYLFQPLFCIVNCINQVGSPKFMRTLDGDYWSYRLRGHTKLIIN